MCVGTAGYGCAAAVTVGLGIAAYALLSGGGSGSSSPLCDGGSCVQGEYTVKSLQRSWVPQTSCQSGTWQFSVNGDSAGRASCAEPGVFVLSIVGSAVGGGSWGPITTVRPQLWWSAKLPNSGDENGCSGGDNNVDTSAGAFLSTDPGFPKYTVVTSGLISDAEGITGPGWEYLGGDLAGGQLGGVCPGGFDNSSGPMVQLPSQTQVSFPQQPGCMGNGQSCTVTTSPPVPDPTPSQIEGDLASPSHSNVNQYLTSVAGGTNGSGQPVTPPGATTLPSCIGDTVSRCETVLGAAGFTGPVTTSEGGCNEQVNNTPPGDVIGQDPMAGSSIDTGQGIAVVTNPSPACIELPQPTANELGAAYVNELQNDGFTNVTLSPVSDDNEDPQLGPNQVIDVQDPATGNDVGWDTEQQPDEPLVVQDNPADAPTPTGNPSPPTPPTAPGLTFPSVPTPCNVFPFGVPCWVVNNLSALNATPQAPNFTVSLLGKSATVDMSNIGGFDMTPYMAPIRDLFAIGTGLGFVIWLARRGHGGSDAGGDGEGGDE